MFAVVGSSNRNFPILSDRKPTKTVMGFEQEVLSLMGLFVEMSGSTGLLQCGEHNRKPSLRRGEEESSLN